MTSEIKINKPEPIEPGIEVALFDRDTDLQQTVQALEAGTPVLITGFYSNGLLLLKSLKRHLKNKFPNTSFQEQRTYRAAYRKLSNLVLIAIDDHSLHVKKAPSIGWLKILYPEISNFLLPFPQVQGLNSSWQWYENGIAIPVLRNKIHPYYGTYFPTRFDHLKLFDTWLTHYKGSKKTAIDVGVGSGILSLQLVQHGFQKVFGTDINPNAIVGLADFMGTTKLSRKIELDHASLFGRFGNQTELIVFNPPWLPETYASDTLDEAIYYNKTLFPRFFEAAKNHLLPEGKLVLLFSNLAQITKVTKEHPIEKELSEGGRFQLEHCYKKRVKVASEITKRDQHWRSSEEVELWVLTHK